MPTTSRRQTKSFLLQQFFKNAGEVWASSPHLRSKLKLHRETKQKSKRKSEELQLPSKSEGCNERTRFQGQLQHAGRQKQGWNPLLPDAKNPFSLRAGFSVRHPHCNCSTGTVARLLFTASEKQGEAVLFAPPRKAIAFLTTLSVCQKHGTGISLPAGSDQGYSP